MGDIEARLESNPRDEAAFQQGVEFLSGRQDWKNLERFYRRNIKRLVAREFYGEMNARLWRELARVYRDRIHHLESARQAFEIAVQMAPNDRDLQAEYQALLDLADPKAKLAQKSSKEELNKASGMEDDALLDKLNELGISADTITTLPLVPLLTVAWADGAVQDRERDAILQGAQTKGIEKGSASFELLNDWLSNEPKASLFEAWAAYISTLRSELTAEQMSILKTQVTRFSLVIAEAAGGLLDDEKKAIAWIESVFDA